MDFTAQFIITGMFVFVYTLYLCAFFSNGFMLNVEFSFMKFSVVRFELYFLLFILYFTTDIIMSLARTAFKSKLISGETA